MRQSPRQGLRKRPKNGAALDTALWRVILSSEQFDQKVLQFAQSLFLPVYQEQQGRHCGGLLKHPRNKITID